MTIHQMLQASSSFETPLYIAALRGQVATVDLLLAHYRSRGLQWQARSPQLISRRNWCCSCSAAQCRCLQSQSPAMCLTELANSGRFTSWLVYSTVSPDAAGPIAVRSRLDAAHGGGSGR